MNPKLHDGEMDVLPLRRCLLRWFSSLVISAVALFSGPLHAEKCDLSPWVPGQPVSRSSQQAVGNPSAVASSSSPPAENSAASPAVAVPHPVDLITTTTFLPGGRTGEFLVKVPAPEQVHIFEVPSTDPREWHNARRIKELVTSVEPMPEKGYERYVSDGYLPSNTSVVRMYVPRAENNLWERRTFVVRLCGREDANKTNSWAIMNVVISDPFSARMISLLAVAVLYAAFSYAIYSIRESEYPLKAKWPDCKSHQPLKWHQYLDPVVLTAGALNQGSIQKLQVLVFSLLVSGMVLSLVLTLGIILDLSPTILMLLGISAVGAAIGQKTTTTNERLTFENWAWLVRRHVLPIHKEEVRPRWSDLVMTHREFDVYKLQTLIFSAIVAVALLITGEGQLDTFEVPETLLGILGLSQVVYIVGGWTRPPSITDLDNAIGELRELEGKLQLAITYNVDTDDQGKLPASLKLPEQPPPSYAERKARGLNVLEQYKRKADQVGVMLESTLEVEVESGKLRPVLDLQQQSTATSGAI